jgi:uncharacterized membrane protein YdcZ (DUF606 family)
MPTPHAAGRNSPHRPFERLEREKEHPMNAIRIAAIVLIAAGVLALAYGNFSYTKSTHEAKIGPIELSVKEKQTVNVPVWAGVGAIVIGAALLVFGGRKG